MSLSLPVAEIERVARSHGAQSVRVFGSWARGAARPESDLRDRILAEARPLEA
jgi:predicted nucleotidyltransferase